MSGIKNFRSIAAFSGISFLCLFCSCTKVNKEFYSDGTLKSEISYHNGKMNGPAVWYWASGNKQVECTYQDDMLEGKVTRWFFNGNKQREDSYHENKRNGTCLVWDESGYQSVVENYLNDTLHGNYKEFHPNGEVMVEGAFNHGFWEGIWSYYDQRGILVGKGDFVHGNGQLKGFFWNGKIKREISYRNNLKNGPEIWYNQEGAKEKEILFENGRINEIITGDTTNVSSNI